MPQQCCSHSRSLYCCVDLPPHRRTFFVTPRPNTGDISVNKGNTACPPAAVIHQMSSMCDPLPVSHLRCHWWHQWWHAAKDVSPLPLTLSSELGAPTSLRDYDPLQQQQSWMLLLHYNCPHCCHHNHMRPPPLTMMLGQGVPPAVTFAPPSRM